MGLLGEDIIIHVYFPFNTLLYSYVVFFWVKLFDPTTSYIILLYCCIKIFICFFAMKESLCRFLCTKAFQELIMIVILFVAEHSHGKLNMYSIFIRKYAWDDNLIPMTTNICSSLILILHLWPTKSAFQRYKHSGWPHFWGFI